MKVDVILSIVSEPTTGYTRASNGEGSDINCYYKFTGGTDGNGNVIVTTMGQRTNIVVILAPDGTKNEYDIVTGFWKGDPVAKMRFEIPGPNRLKIIDDADVIDDVAYSVVVTPRKVLEGLFFVILVLLIVGVPRRTIRKRRKQPREKL
jgi:hypothetical protein